MKKKVKTRFLSVVATALCFVAILTGFSLAGYPVSVTNWPMLGAEVQTVVTQVITQKLSSIWQEEIDKFKLKLGNLSGLTSGLSGSFLNNDYTAQIDNFSSKFGVTLGNFASDSKNGKDALSSLLLKGASVSMPKLSEALTSPSSYMKSLEQVSMVLAGVPESLDKSSMGLSDIVQVTRKDLYNQAAARSLEQGGQAVIISEKFKKEMEAFSPSKIDSGVPEQAIKDAAKIMYYNAMLQAEMLKTLGQAEQRNALANN